MELLNWQIEVLNDIRRQQRKSKIKKIFKL